MMKAACRTRVISARTILLVVAHNEVPEKGRMTMRVISITFIVPLPSVGGWRLKSTLRPSYDRIMLKLNYYSLQNVFAA